MQIRKDWGRKEFPASHGCIGGVPFPHRENKGLGTRTPFSHEAAPSRANASQSRRNPSKQTGTVSTEKLISHTHTHTHTPTSLTFGFAANCGPGFLWHLGAPERRCRMSPFTITRVGPGKWRQQQQKKKARSSRRIAGQAKEPGWVEVLKSRGNSWLCSSLSWDKKQKRTKGRGFSSSSSFSLSPSKPSQPRGFWRG